MFWTKARLEREVSAFKRMFFFRSERVYPAIELFEKPIRLDSWREASRYDQDFRELPQYKPENMRWAVILRQFTCVKREETFFG